MHAEQKNFKYRAFISYSHNQKDETVASWLIEALEKYRFPKSLAEKLGRRALGRIYRDKDEAPATADLSNHIKKELAESEYLIVLCSPASKKSKWVSEEIKYFIELRGASNILAVLVEGEPETSFPDALAAEPGAVDLRIVTKENKNSALIKLVAGVTNDLDYATLANREGQREKRRLHLGIFTAIAAAVVILAVSMYLFQLTSERNVALAEKELQVEEEARRIEEEKAKLEIHNQYYASVETRFLLPVGIIPVSKDKFDRMHHGFQFRVQDGKVLSVIRKEKFKVHDNFFEII